MFLALKEIKSTKSRYLLIAGVIALISYLVYFLVALAFGLASSNRTGIDHFKSSGLIITKSANKNIITSNFDESIIKTPSSNIALLNSTQTVVYLNDSTNDDEKINVSLFGTEENSFLIPKLIEGSYHYEDNKVLASISLKKENNLKLGDTIKIAQTGKVFTITGFVENSKYNTAAVIYTKLEDASIMKMMLNPNTQTEEVTDALDKMPKMISALVMKEKDQTYLDSLDDSLTYISTNELIEKIPGYSAQVLTFGLMIIFLILISSIVIGIFMYILTIQKKNVFGIMKAQGIPSRVIEFSVIYQTFILTLLGTTTAFIFTIISGFLLPVKVPFTNNYLLYSLITILIFLFSLSGTLISARSVSKIDPLDAIE